MRVVRSAGQNVSPSDDGRLFDQIFTDGLFTDASITNLGANNVALSALYGTICGRDFTAEAQNIVVTLPEGDGEYTGYIYVEIDTSSEDVITINSALAPFTPTYEDINTNGAVVQMILAEYTATALAIQSITPVYTIASAGGIGSLAVIETSPARSNHSKDTFLVYEGTLYKVTAAIVAGENLVVGTNITATTTGSELESLNKGLMRVASVPTTGFPYDDYGSFKMDGLQFVRGSVTVPANQSGYVAILNSPSRPVRSMILPASVSYGQLAFPTFLQITDNTINLFYTDAIRALGNVNVFAFVDVMYPVA